MVVELGVRISEFGGGFDRPLVIIRTASIDRLASRSCSIRTWVNGHRSITLLIPMTRRLLISEAVPKGLGLIVVVGVAVVTLHGQGRSRAADRWLIIAGRHVSFTAGPIWPAGRRELFAAVEVSFRAPIADHRRAVSALQV